MKLGEGEMVEQGRRLRNPRNPTVVERRSAQRTGRTPFDDRSMGQFEAGVETSHYSGIWLKGCFSL